jgi:hypothetical protein
MLGCGAKDAFDNEENDAIKMVVESIFIEK